MISTLPSYLRQKLGHRDVIVPLLGDDFMETGLPPGNVVMANYAFFLRLCLHRGGNLVPHPFILYRILLPFSSGCRAGVEGPDWPSASWGAAAKIGELSGTGGGLNPSFMPPDMG